MNIIVVSPHVTACACTEFTNATVGSYYVRSNSNDTSKTTFIVSSTTVRFAANMENWDTSLATSSHMFSFRLNKVIDNLFNNINY